MCLQNIYLLLVLLYYAQAELFTAKPKDVEEFEGQIATLKCFLGEFIEAKYVVSWWKAGSKLTEQNEVVTMDERMTVNLDELPYPGAFSYSLLITNILLKDEGGYHCQIDRTPPITSGIARLTVLQVPSVEYPKCTKSANSYIVGSQVGRFISLLCTMIPEIVLQIVVSMIDLYLVYRTQATMVTGDTRLHLKFLKILTSKDICT
ncbi:uncharacterized protein LOC117118356 isoform X2 [Anneissia japonica]|uniref:uncharacterized protein LOC117118356 isoform X2 n=1 Tax=Anneissia japonica TaxID=1529436 RepID=UPI001425663D|nr:uncharacterized protein LOC117118356 isoform X2 [Anneissia japonica]